MRRVATFVCLLLLVGSTVSAAHYWNEVRKARAETASLVKNAFEKFGRRVSLRDMSAARLNVLLKIEDPTFKTHRGVDLATPGAGMTTITQGLVKLL